MSKLIANPITLAYEEFLAKAIAEDARTLAGDEDHSPSVDWRTVASVLTIHLRTLADRIERSRQLDDFGGEGFIALAALADMIDKTKIKGN